MVSVSLQLSVFVLFRYILGHGIDRSYVNYIFHFLRNLHTVFHSKYTNTNHKAKQNSPAQFILSYLERHSLHLLSPQIHETPLAKARPLSSTEKSHQVRVLEVLLVEKETSQVVI